MRIGVDLDGTLAEYHGYVGPNHVGNLLPGAKKWLEELVAAGHEVLIFTARGNEPEGLAATMAWIKAQGIEPLIKGVTASKLYSFDLFLDDRAVRFEGTYPSVDSIAAIRPWWK